MDVVEFVFLDIGGGVSPFRKWLTVKNPVWNAGSAAPTTLESGTLVITDKRDQMELNSNPGTRSHMMARISSIRILVRLCGQWVVRSRWVFLISVDTVS